MAAAVATPTVVTQITEGIYRVSGTIAITASAATYTTGGIVLNFLQALIKASRKPLSVVVNGIAGYTYAYVMGTDASDGLLKIFVPKVTGAAADDPMIELTSSLAIPAAVSGDTISFVAVFKGME